MNSIKRSFPTSNSELCCGITHMLEAGIMLDSFPLFLSFYWKLQLSVTSTESVNCWIPTEKAMATHSSTLALKIPWTEEPGRLQSMGLLRVGHEWATSLSLFTFLHWRRKRQPTPVFLPGESQGQRNLLGAIYGVTQSQTRLTQLSSNNLRLTKPALPPIFFSGFFFFGGGVRWCSSWSLEYIPLKFSNKIYFNITQRTLCMFMPPTIYTFRFTYLIFILLFRIFFL